MLTQTISDAIPNKKTDGKFSTSSSISSQANSSNADLFRQVFDNHSVKEQRSNKTELKDKPKNSQDKQEVQTDSENLDKSNDIENSSTKEVEEQSNDDKNISETEQSTQTQVAVNENTSKKSVEFVLDIEGETTIENLDAGSHQPEKELDNVALGNAEINKSSISNNQQQERNEAEATVALYAGKTEIKSNIIAEANKDESLNNSSINKAMTQVNQDDVNEDKKNEILEDIEIEEADIQENDQAVNLQITSGFVKTQTKSNDNTELALGYDAKNLSETNKDFNKENINPDITVNTKDETGNIPLDELELANKSGSNENTLQIDLNNKKETSESVKVKEKQQLQPAELNAKNTPDSLQNKLSDENNMQQGANNGQNFGQPNNLETGIMTFDNDKLNLSFKEVASNFSDNVPHRADQISLAIKTCIQNNRKEISINMYPETLGNVDVKLEFNKDQIVAIKIFAEKPETLKILIKDISTLEKSLSEVVKTDDASLSFNLKDGQNGNEYEPNNNQANRVSFNDESTIIGKNYQISNLSLQDGAVDIRV